MNWRILEPEQSVVARLKSDFKTSEIIARVMANRGIESLVDSRAFFTPSIMETTLFLAKIMGVCFTAMGLAILLNLKYYMKAFDAFFKNTALIYLAGFFTLVIGILLVLVHNSWVEDWTVVITVLAWLTLVKGLFLMLFPEWTAKTKKTFLTKGYMTFAGIFAFLLGLCLLFKGFELCPLT